MEALRRNFKLKTFKAGKNIFLVRCSDDNCKWLLRATKLESLNMFEIRSFANCELRSMVIVDRSMIGSDAPTTNHPGKIPSCVDLPSDVAAEKHPKQGASQ
ncbi:hypothetical protein WN944_007879 [Citrus x changshan-huyou]|uniref:Transposase MuDR plant domain-containing protein n=1 Tax=Citrus x changshan-huyou TaxID=2935761 RepID=A0AAP0MPD7_9ROSI